MTRRVTRSVAALSVDAMWSGMVNSTPQSFYHQERAPFPKVGTGGRLGPGVYLEGYVEEMVYWLTEVRTSACPARSDSLCQLLCLGTFNPLTPNDHYSGRTAPLTSKRCILYIYSTNIDTEYFKHGIQPPFFSLQNAVCVIILMYLVPVLFTFYIQDVLKFKKIIPTPKG